MRKLAAFAGAAALGLSGQAFGYNATMGVEFDFGGSATYGAGSDQGFVSSGGPVNLASISNSTFFSGVSGANSQGIYNGNFADTASCAAAIPSGASLTSVRQYGCRYNGSLFAGIPVSDARPGGRARGTVTVSDTLLQGVLTIVSTTDEPLGATTVSFNGTRIATSTGLGTNGYNYRSADGSPFGNSWYGTTTSGTLTVNLTGTFTATHWNITGGWVDYSDSGFACQQGGFGGDARGTLCTPSGTGGGFANDGGNLSWGMDTDGGLTTPGSNPIPGEIQVRDQTNAIIGSLSGVIASVSLDAAGNMTTHYGEFRRGLGSAAACTTFLRYDTVNGQLTCGSLTAGFLTISGIVPVPAGVWLFCSALGVLGYIRRKIPATV